MSSLNKSPFLPFRRPTLAIALLCLSHPLLAQNQGPVNLKVDESTLGGIKSTPEDEATYINADKLYGNSSEETFLEGNVELKRNDIQINSDALSYSPVTDRATANGNLVIQQPGITLKAPSGSVKVGSKELELKQPTFEIKQSGGKGKADHLVFDGIDTLTLENPNYTVCEVPNPGQADQGDWYVRANRLELDQSAEVGRAQGAMVVFKDVPILAAPYFSFPTSDRRKSGFLAPSFGTVSNSGAEITVPYYWNIAPDKDMTLYPKAITGRGFQLGTQTRFMNEHNRAELKYDYLPNDRKTDTTRSALSFQDSFVKGNFNAGMNINKVSDDQYFVDFSRSQAVASQRILLREGFANYEGGAWRTNVRAVRHQTLQLVNDIVVEPYDRLPEVNLELSATSVGNSFVSVNGQYTDFANPGSVSNRIEGSRAVTRARLFMPINRSAFSFIPAISVQANSYTLNNSLPGQESNPSSVIPTASLDSTVYFDRKTRIFGRDLNQTLEPRLFYLYTPFKDQSDQPLFDTSVTDQSFSRIFSENRYAGYDRVGDANQLTLAMTSRFSDAGTGEELFSAALGQRLNIKKPQIILPTLENPVTNDSDFFAMARGRITQNLSADAASQISAETGRHEKGNLSLSYAPSQGKQVNAGYRYTRAQINQFDLSGQWPITRKWSGVGRINYSVLESRLIEGLAGLEYSEGCWVLRMVAQRFATAPELETTSVFVQLELTGLGRIGSNPLDLLSRNVPGYTPFTGTSND